MIYQNIRPIPYYSIPSNRRDRELGAALRHEFKAKIARRFPGHHLRGFQHDFIIRYVKKHKQTHPYFVRTDITKFYPSIRHRDLVAHCQLAYRQLLGLDYIPNTFKKKYLPAMQDWCKRLPGERGIPLGNAVSAILSPVLLVPLWMEVRRRFNPPFIVYTDDILVLAKTQEEVARIYTFIASYLTTHLDLSLQVDKTLSGRISRTAFSFCGWEFTGGYSRICATKVVAFKKRIGKTIQTSKICGLRSFIKRINCKIDGFGNYYKHGDVARQYDELDKYIRSLVRKRLGQTTKTKKYTNAALYQLGLHSLRISYDKRHQSTKVRAQPTLPKDYYAIKPSSVDSSQYNRHLAVSETISIQLKELISLQRQTHKTLQKLSTALQRV